MKVQEALTEVMRADPSKAGKPRAWYLCPCGTRFIAQVGNVKSGNTRSCGCVRRALNTTHGQANSPLYKCWGNMRQRCTDIDRYPTYAGVECDPRWSTFEGFISNPPSGEYSPGLCLSRFNDAGDYTPENTRWLTRSANSTEQARVKRARQ